MTDPYAAAAAAQQVQTEVSAPVEVSGGYAVGEFATADDYGSGEYTPSPKIDYLLGRMCVLLPLRTKNIPDRNDPNKMNSIWITDLYVLSGGPFSFKYEKIVSEKDEVPVRKEWTTFDVTNACTPEDPFYVHQWWSFGRYVNYKLTQTANDRDRFSGKVRPFLGIVQRVPSKQSKPGATIESIAADFLAFEANPREIKEPKFAWDMVSPDATMLEAAKRWRPGPR